MLIVNVAIQYRVRLLLDELSQLYIAAFVTEIRIGHRADTCFSLLITRSSDT